jgi:hypothetical protein
MADADGVSSPVDECSTPLSQDGGPPGREAPGAYLARHGVHTVVDRMVRDILSEKPSDPGPWMQRWLLEHHRQQCAERHSMSPLSKLRPDSATQPAVQQPPSPLSFEEEADDAPQ